MKLKIGDKVLLRESIGDIDKVILRRSDTYHGL